MARRGPVTTAMVNLPNGCACCTLGDGLHQALGRLAADPGLDHVIVEVSGVADPAAVAAWSTVEPFEPGGVIVLAAADSIRALATDRYVGGEVCVNSPGRIWSWSRRSTDVTERPSMPSKRWLDRIVPTVPRVRAVRGDLPPICWSASSPTQSSGELRIVAAGHTDRYETWAWNTGHPLDRGGWRSSSDALPAGVLRLKGWVLLSDGDMVDVNVVGRSREIAHRGAAAAEGRASALVAIGVRGTADPFADGIDRARRCSAYERGDWRQTAGHPRRCPTPRCRGSSWDRP